MNSPDYFIPDRDARTFYPLRSFLRAPSLTVAQRYIETLTAPGDLVLDPFGAMPNVAQAALALGRRAIVVESNPLWAWLARAMATLPPATEINAALTQLGDALKDDAPLRAHIAQLYTTVCAACDKPTPADYFVHTRGAGPLRRHYTCAHCGETRDDSATEDDLKKAASFNARGLHFHLAFERVAPADNLHAERIRRMLDVYTPRNLYALVTLTQKIDSLFHATRERDILLLLLLHLLDRGTSFYKTPADDAQLTTHKQFVEFNLWREIEIAARALASDSNTFTLEDSIADVVASDTAAVFVGRGNAATLAREVHRQSAALVLAAPPIRRTSVWALSYFWGAWLLGRAAAQPLTMFLDDKKEATWEWRWYSDLLNDSLSAAAELLRADAHVVFAFNESWHLVIETLLMAATSARLQLDSFLFQPRRGDFPHGEFDDLRGDYRIAFTPTLSPSPVEDGGGPGVGVYPGDLANQIQHTAFVAANDILTRRGEALAYAWLHHAAYSSVARAGLIAQAQASKPKATPGRFVHDAVVSGLKEGYVHDFDHYASPTQFVWIRQSKKLDPPLIDRVEDLVRDILARGAAISQEELEDALYRQFPGDLTPEAGLIELCASTYADERNGKWEWRAEDTDINKSHALDLLARLGERIGYAIAQDAAPFPLAWKMDGEIAHGFVWRDRPLFADVIQIHTAPARGYIVIPESRVALMQEKTQRLPHLADAFHEAGWQFVRVPFVEKLLNAEKVDQSDLPLIVGLAPPMAEDKTQLELL